MDLLSSSPPSTPTHGGSNDTGARTEKDLRDGPHAENVVPLRRRRGRGTESPREQERALNDAAVRRKVEDARPRTRDECRDGPRPCLFVSCRHHLFLDVNERSGSIRFSFPGARPDEIPETCALDVAERGGLTLEEIGEMLNLTRERVRQLEQRALRKMLNVLDAPEP